MKKKLAFLATFLCSTGFAQEPIRVLDIGVMGLASHDLFQWNGRTKTNEENGRFDLSTIFDYGNGEKIRQGGNSKNSSNAAVFTVTQSLVSFYYGQKASLLMSRRFTEEQAHEIARKETVTFFIGMVKESYQRFSDKSLPEVASSGSVTDEEQAVMRALHDILPGKITVNRGVTSQTFEVTDYKTAMTFLSPTELNQEVKFFDGKYDVEYLNVSVPGPRGPITINLQEADQQFVEGQTDFNFSIMLGELGRYGNQTQQYTQNLVEYTSFGYHLENLFAKGLCKQNPDGTENKWVMPGIVCN
ncbi:hypothetical protein H0A36_22690 [Endozoicomonas sp. SM1973]|uniref:Uncharacterized protein n=1 Tax=Spartinivicinus marinus TaxID=2994442 RepID=A0A853I4J4_9GAMM|nr:hypothetical protein [Spartinivicinus marinus]MCX4025900.1 hypothetical protein [Spartinivicinus marinus]NYZ68830.1 hypothetical protein [Spartinivicinus marinus]